MADIVYILCALTSLTCAILLLRSFSANRVRLLLWSGLCFGGFALNNILLIIDMRVMTGTDLSIIRTIPAFLGLLLLLYGMVWDAR